MRLPVYLPRLAVPSRCTCECKVKEINMEYKNAILTWQVNPGEYVHKDDVICEAEVEKSVIDVLSPANGRLDKNMYKKWRNERDTKSNWVYPN